MIVYAMLYTIAVGVPIVLTAMIAAALLRRRGHPERGVWLGALGLSFLLPLVGLLRPSTGGGVASPAPAADGVVWLPELVVQLGAESVLSPTEAVLAVWIAASAFLALRWAVAAARLALRGRGWSRDTLDGVPVVRSGDLGPAVAGVLRPRILAPEWLTTLPARQRSLILLHEQEHIRAGDPALLVLARLARLVTPWNPVTWVLCARLVRAIELDCDRRVLRRRPDVRAYGDTLLDVSSRDASRLVAVAAFAESEAPLRSRILAMTTPPRTVSIVSLLVAAVFGVVLMVAAFEIPVPALRISVEVDPASGGGAAEPTGQPTGEPAAEPPAEPSPEPTAPVAPPEAEEPPDVEEVLEERRQERAERMRPPEPLESRGGMSEEEIARIGVEPVFTPFTAAPSILNRDEVVRAMIREYPALLRDAGIGGTIRVYFYIDDTGRVRDTRIDQSSGHPALDDASLAVASVYRFSPALNRDAPTPVWVSFPITFQVR